MRPESENPCNPPSEFCPHPEWWHSESMSATEIEVSEFIGGLVRLIQPELCVETGTYLGQTSQLIGGALKKNGHGRLITLETQGGYCEVVRGLCADLPVEVVEMAAEAWTPPATIDFLFLDSGGDRYIEFKRYLPWLKSGSVWCLHDTHAPHHAAESFLKIKAEFGHLFWGIEFNNPRGFYVGRMV